MSMSSNLRRQAQRISVVAAVIIGILAIGSAAFAGWLLTRSDNAASSYQSSSTNWISWGENSELYAYTEWDDRYLGTGEELWVFSYLKPNSGSSQRYAFSVGINPDPMSYDNLIGAGSGCVSSTLDLDITYQDDGELVYEVLYETPIDAGECVKSYIQFDWDYGRCWTLPLNEIADPPGSSGDDLVWGAWWNSALTTDYFEVYEDWPLDFNDDC